MTRRFIQQQGFSLIEMLVAFAILALVLTTILQIYGNGAKASRLSYEYNQAVIIAQSKLAFIKMKQNELSGIDLQKYNWRVTRHPEPVDNAILTNHFRLDRIITTVTWQAAGKQRQVELSTLQLVNQ